MKLKSVSLVAFAAAGLLFASCKKDNNNNPGSGNLAAGQCTISFDTDKDFGGSKSTNLPASQTTTVAKGSQGNRDNISMNANATGTSGVKTALLSVLPQSGATTDNGSLTAKFDGASTDVTNATLTISATSLSGNQSFTMKSGTLTVTKLNSDVIEGTFNGTGENTNNNETITVSNGKFAAKFK